jgi:DNA-cytosine methyltransferase
MPRKNYTVLDLFCGCGGLSLGFEMAGFDILLGIDNWKEALITFEKNHTNSRTFCCDLSTLLPSEIQKDFLKNGIDIIIGGPPCQGFSISGKRDVNDPRNKLYRSFKSFVEYFKPQAFIMENVPNLVSMDKGKVKDEIISKQQYNELIIEKDLILKMYNELLVTKEELLNKSLAEIENSVAVIIYIIILSIELKMKLSNLIYRNKK